jgi:hypothetical protein
MMDIEQLKKATYPDCGDLKKRVAELEETQRWIPVEERLPTRADASGNAEVIAWYKTGGFAVVAGWSWARDCKNISHWMPLPKPPEEE